jgi:trk system potassium uptake protein
MGCGRVGSMLATELESLGHSVAVIDQDASAFRRLGPNFAGIKVKGMGFDREHLKAAGIERADAFAAVSSGDNSNILAARTVRETFGVAKVVARIYDHRRAEVFQRLGIPTVATVSWTAEQMLRRIVPSGAAEEWSDPTGTLSLAEMQLAASWIGTQFTKIEHHAGVRIATITRLGSPLLPTHDTVYQDGDIVRVILPVAQIAQVTEAFAKGPVD